jgi:hypothetical protein
MPARSSTISRPVEIALVIAPWLLAAAVTLAWSVWAWRMVGAFEEGAASRSGVAFAVFVQTAHNWNQGVGWVQTVHPNYVEAWHWGGHFGLLWLPVAKLSALSDSPWFLARFQVLWIGAGCFVSWLLGRAEGGAFAGLAGAALYAGSGAVALIALDDYQDLALCLPLIPLAVLAARRGPWWSFVLAAVLLALVREELWFLLPLAGLSRDLGRALLGMVVALACYGLLLLCSPIALEPPVLFRILEPSAQGVELGVQGLSLGPQLRALGASLPFAPLQPACAVAAAGVSLLHAQPELREFTGGFGFPHHFAPALGFGLAGATVGLGMLARLHRWAGPGVLAMACLASGLALIPMQGELEALVQRGEQERHPAWDLLDQVPGDAVLYVPSHLSPAAARRRWLANERSVPARVPAVRVTHAVVPEGCGVEGEVVARSGAWVLLAKPTALPGSGDPLPWSLQDSLFRGCIPNGSPM